MEIFNRETNPRDGDDDEEESGVTGGKKSKKESWFRREEDEDEDEDEYHWLHPGASGEFFLPRQEGMFNHLLGESKEDDEEDEDGEEEKNKEAGEAEEKPEVEHEIPETEELVAENQDMETTEELSAEEAQEESQAEADQLQARPEGEQPVETSEEQGHESWVTDHDEVKAPQATDKTEEAVPSPPQESMTQSNQEKPKWLEEDEQKFQQIMESEADESFKKAASSETLTSQEPGREPPAVERTTNESVSLEPEPTHQVEGFRQEEQFEGYAPGPQRGDASQETESVPPTGRETVAAPPNEGNPLTSEELSRKYDRLSLRQKMATSLLFMAATYGYFANRRRKREIRHQEKELNQVTRKYQTETERMAGEQQQMRERSQAQQEQITRMQQQQRAAQEAGPAREQQSVPPAGAAQREQTMAAQPPEARTVRPEHAAPGMSAENAPADSGAEEEPTKSDRLDPEAARRAVERAMSTEEPQRHVEQDAWRRYVVDEHGHEVHEAMHYGHEYDKERAHETLSSDADASTAGPEPDGQEAQEGQPAFGGSSPWQQSYPAQAQYEEKIASGQAPTDHSQPLGMSTQADWQHQLPEKHQNPVVGALTSPWLFLLLSLILLAYFIATLL